jgi:hypothetical protein
MIVAKSDAGTSADGKALPANLQAAVDAGSILSFVEGVSPSEVSDVLFSVQLAQRAADAAFDPYAETRNWYTKYGEVLEAVGWVTEQFAFAAHNHGEGDFVMNKAALGVIAGIATGNQLQVITASISALEKLADGDGAITLFEQNSAMEGSGNFQIGAVQKKGDTLSMALGAFYFRSHSERRKFLFFRWGKNDINFWTAAMKMTFNIKIYAKVRESIERKLGAQALDYIKQIEI